MESMMDEVEKKASKKKKWNADSFLHFMIRSWADDRKRALDALNTSNVAKDLIVKALQHFNLDKEAEYLDFECQPKEKVVGNLLEFVYEYDARLFEGLGKEEYRTLRALLRDVVMLIDPASALKI
jgi:hypothetical protein